MIFILIGVIALIAFLPNWVEMVVGGALKGTGQGLDYAGTRRGVNALSDRAYWQNAEQQHLQSLADAALARLGDAHGAAQSIPAIHQLRDEEAGAQIAAGDSLTQGYQQALATEATTNRQAAPMVAGAARAALQARMVALAKTRLQAESLRRRALARLGQETDIGNRRLSRYARDLAGSVYDMENTAAALQGNSQRVVGAYLNAAGDAILSKGAKSDYNPRATADQKTIGMRDKTEKEKKSDPFRGLA